MRFRRQFLALLASMALLAALVPSASAASPKWMLTYYDGEDGPFTTPAVNPPGETIATFAFDLEPNQALLTSTDHQYLQNGNLLGDTVTSTFAIKARAGTTFVGYDDGCADVPPTVRFYFETKLQLGAQTTFQTGLYEDQRWWSNPVSISLADLFALGRDGTTLSVKLDPENWSNLVGQFGDTLVEPYIADFSTAASNVSKIGLSFGSHCNFAFGDGSNPAGARFNLLDFSTQVGNHGDGHGDNGHGHGDNGHGHGDNGHGHGDNGHGHGDRRD
jgi:hypothetical protein